MTRTLFITLVAASLAAPLLFAEENSADDKLLRDSLASFKTAFDAHDVDAMLESWSDDVDVIDQNGGRLQGKTAVAEAYRELFERCPEATVAVDVAQLRVAGNAALVDGVASVTPGDDQPVESTRFTAVFSRKDPGSGWHVAAVREASLVAASTKEKLEPLAWLVGDWISESDAGDHSYTTVQWSDDGEELRRTTLSSENGSRRLVESRILWNPGKERLESRTREEGRLAVGVWTQDGDNWVVETTETSLDGGVVRSKYVIAPEGEDAVSMTAVERTVDGEAQTELPKSVLKRVN